MKFLILIVSSKSVRSWINIAKICAREQSVQLGFLNLLSDVEKYLIISLIKT